MSATLFARLRSVRLEASTFCCGCSLRSGVLFFSSILLINAILAFAGEAALFSGMLTATVSQAEKAVLPPGTKFSDVRIQGGVVFLGVYCLFSSISGFVAALRRDKCASLILYVTQVIDFVITVLMIIITWLAGGSFANLLSLIPTVFFNAYMVVIIRSYYLSLARPEGVDYADATATTTAEAGVLDGPDIDESDDVVVVEAAGAGKKSEAEDRAALAAAKAAKD